MALKNNILKVVDGFTIVELVWIMTIFGIISSLGFNIWNTKIKYLLLQYEVGAYVSKLINAAEIYFNDQDNVGFRYNELSEYIKIPRCSKGFDNSLGRENLDEVLKFCKENVPVTSALYVNPFMPPENNSHWFTPNGFYRIDSFRHGTGDMNGFRVIFLVRTKNTWPDPYKGGKTVLGCFNTDTGNKYIYFDKKHRYTPRFWPDTPDDLQEC